MLTIRPGAQGDLEAVAAIQAVSPEAAQWPAADYLQQEFWVAVAGARIHGFLVARKLVEGEWELLNMAVAVESRHRGVGRALLEKLLSTAAGSVFLEVRESNSGARKFYESMGFSEIGKRPGYYRYPSETAVVMKFHSC
jgi:[ribosomal protein S18]-alanine N-acetyltransferase